MNRSPAYRHAEDAFGVSNGFRFRRSWLVGVTASFTLPLHAPQDERGLVLVKAAIIGAGSGRYSDGGSSVKPGAGGGYSEKIWAVPPGSVAEITVGAPGVAGLIGANIGGDTTLVLAGVTLLATGGAKTGPNTGGIGTGGDINTMGGSGQTFGVGGDGSVGGCSAGSPWGNGRSTAGVPGPGWLKPDFWDFQDADAATFIELTGLGQGASATLPAGNGGGGGTSGNVDGGAGAAFVWF